MGIGFLSSFESPREDCGQDGSPRCRGISFSIDFRSCIWLKNMRRKYPPWAASLGLVSPGPGPTSRDAAGMRGRPQESPAPGRAPEQTVVQWDPWG